MMMNIRSHKFIYVMVAWCLMAVCPGVKLSAQDRDASGQDSPATQPQEAQAKQPQEAQGEQPQEAQAKQPQDQKAEDAKPAESPLKLSGVFIPTRSVEIMLKPKEWTSWVAEQAVEHGTRVQDGETLLQMDKEDLNNAIRDLESEIAADELSLQQAQLQLEISRKSLPLSLQAAEDAERLATEDLKRFLTVDRPRQIRNLERSVETTRNYLTYQEEELRQLEKMYAADDLTEETEEIILQRTRNAVESARYSLELAQESQTTGRDVTLPRRERDLENAVRQASLAWEDARERLPRQLQLEELQVKKQEQQLEKKRQRLARLREDLTLLRLTAPEAGIVYYGESAQGKWSDVASVRAVLQPGASVKTKSVLMTIVQPRPIQIRAMAPEKHVAQVTVHSRWRVRSEAYPDQEAVAEVTKVSNIPVGDAVFEVTLDVTLPDEAAILPGMKCELTPADKQDQATHEESDKNHAQ